MATWKSLRQLAPITLAAVVALIVAGCDNQSGGKPVSGAPLRSVKLLLDWKAEPTYAGFYIAKARGEYKKLGLDVQLVEGSGATTSAQLIAAGNDYLVGSDSGEATAIARSRGLPLKSVAVFYHDTPTVIYSRADSPIKRPSDLPGKTIGLISGSITTDEYRGLIIANGIDRSTIKEVGTGFDVAPLLNHQVDGLMDYAELTPVQLQLKGYSIQTMRLSAFGVRAYSLNLIVNDKLLSQDPALVRSIVAATIKGYDFVRQNPDEAARIFSSLFPEKSHDYVLKSMRVVAQQLDSPVGRQTRDGWQATINTLASLQLLNRKVSVDEVAASDYLDK